MMEEREYRKLVDQTFRTIEKAFDLLDPDMVEFELSQGSVTLLFKNGTRCILSTQPSVRQLWVAAASMGIAHHFNYDPASEQWLDDKAMGVELLSFIRDVVRTTVGIEPAFER